MTARWLAGFAGAVAAVVLCAGAPISAQPQRAAAAEVRTAERLRGMQHDAAAVRAFVTAMPKGGDLHMHLSGAVYAETFLRDAAEDLLCADPVKLVLLPNVGTTRSIPPKPVCADGTVAAASAFTNQRLYDALIDSFSMRGFVPSAGVTGHDQFFATFGRFDGIRKQHQGEWVDELATRAAAQNEQYLEIMLTPEFSLARKLAAETHWEGQPAALRDRLLQAGLRDEVAADRAELDEIEQMRNRREHCGTAEAQPACSVTVRYLYQVLRANAPEQVFAQTLLGYEVASADARVVGINFVQPEDAYMAMSQYDAQMSMLAYLHTAYPHIHLSLHAGELALGLVPPDGLRFHIRDAVEKAAAERIGHGVDVMYEDDPDALLRTMAARHVMVEVNLTSNDVILGVRGSAHPLHAYMAAGVPVALSTDDEGVSRIDLTNEYARVVLEQGLSYAELKRSARTSLEHAFVEGASLWRAPDDFAHAVSGCESMRDKPADACDRFLKTSAKAAMQYELERRFRVFEAAQAALPETRVRSTEEAR